MGLTAMVLAAGKGVRIAPLSFHLAKPALPVLGRALVLRTVERLAAAGVERLAVNLHHQGASIREALSRAHAGIREIHFSPEDELLGTGGGARKVLAFLRAGGAETVVVWNGDAHADLDLRVALEAHRRSGRRATLVLVAGDVGRYGAVRERDGRISGFDRLAGGRAPGGRPFVFAGIHLLDSSLLERLPEGRPSDLVLDLYRPMIEGGEDVGAFVHAGRWLEIGSPMLYRDTVLRLAREADGEGRTWLGDGLVPSERDEGRVLLGPAADASHAVSVEGAVVMEGGATAAEGARLADSVLLASAAVGPGASVHGSIVGPGAVVPAGTDLDGVAAVRDPGPGAALPPGARRERGLVVRDLAEPFR